ncbi:hypothetical protein AWB78_01276 [Caballeronia calidae]|uniref:Uncharacterized protein n=1 Tax=Caballeronia calidae TaxID=1777139 RepID=A0A158A5G0_9BURK|nr:hypothetical protein [Caballeronia calidae]SAK52949.1 hypothetical protein AWB78_01276 [Caballeronia calidae]
MNAIPQPKTHQIVDRINALQAASPRFIDPSEISPRSREWRAIRHDIDQLMRVDACAAWELTGSWRGLAGDVEGAEAAFRNSVALGLTDVGRENWMIMRLNLGLFSEAQALYRALGTPSKRDLVAIARYGFLAGAIGRTAELIEETRAAGFAWNDEWAEQVMTARRIMVETDVTDQQAGRLLDCAGTVLRRHGFRPVVVPRVLYVEDICRSVNYSLRIPLPWQQAHDMKHEVIREEGRQGALAAFAFYVTINGESL